MLHRPASIQKPFIMPLAISVLLMSFVSPLHAGFRALLVGISDYGDRNHNLPSVENDLELLTMTLKKNYGVTNDQIKTLRNATTSKVIGDFTEHLINQCHPDDVVLFYFSGHGNQVPELGPDSDEDDSKDEVLETFDFDAINPQTWLTDDDIHNLLMQVPARHVLLIHDSCYSGTGTRSFMRGGDAKLPMLPEQVQSGKGSEPPFNWTTRSAFGVDDYSLRDKHSRKNHVFVSACQASEEAHYCYDERVSGKAGILTQAICTLLSSGAAQQPLDQAERSLRGYAGRAFGKYLPTIKPPQQPTIETERRDITLDDLLKGKVYSAVDPAPPPPPQPAPTPPGKLEVTLRIPEPAIGYRHTENLTATVSVSRPAFVRVYYAAATGKITQIYPNRDQPLQKLEPGNQLSIPSSKSHFRLGPPKGAGPTETFIETLIAVASPSEFSDADAHAFANGRYHDLPKETTVPSLLSRSITIEARQRGDFGYTNKSFRLVPPSGK